MLKKIIKKILSTKSSITYLQSALDIGQNNNIGDMQKNGEAWLVQKYANSWSIAFDVGANVGHWSNLVSKTNGATKIYAFEPVSETRDILTQNATANVTIVPSALSDRSETVTISTYSGDSGLNSIARTEISGVQKIGTEEIQVISLDSFCEKEHINAIDMLKIDVEGYETKVLQGARKMLEQGKIGMIQFEYGPAYIDSRTYLKDIFELFKDKPYTIYKLMPESLSPIQAYDFDLETMRYSNYVCIKND